MLPLFDDRETVEDIRRWLERQAGTTTAHDTSIEVAWDDGRGYTSYRVTAAVRTEGLARLAIASVAQKGSA